MFVTSRYGLEHFTLPDFGVNQTEGLQVFLESFFRLRLPDYYYINLYVVSGLVGLIEVFGMAVIAKQLWNRTLWLFRVQETSTFTNLVVPNSTASFIFFEGIFGLTYLGYVFYTRAIDMGQISPDGRSFYTLYAWIGLFFGAHIAAVGTLYTSPGLLSRSASARSTKRLTIRSLVPSPLLCNLWFIGYPSLIGAAMIVVGALAGEDYMHAAQKWHVLNSELLSQAPDAPISQDQALRAMQIWQGYASSYWFVSLGFLIFCVAAGALLAFYTGASVYLISTLRYQIEQTGGGFFGGFRTLTKSVEAPDWNEEGGNQEANRAAAEEETRAAQSTFFPPIRGASARHTEAKTQQQRVHVLKSALKTVTVMAVCINLGIIGYCCNTAYISITIYNAASTSPEQIAHVWLVFNLVAAWLAITFGTLTFFSILTKTYSEFFDSKSFTFISSNPRRGSRASKDVLQLGQRKNASISLQVPDHSSETGEGSQHRTSSNDGFTERKNRMESIGDEEARLSDEKARTNHPHQRSESSKEPEAAEELSSNPNPTEIPSRDFNHPHYHHHHHQQQIDPLASAAQLESVIDTAPPLDIRPSSAASSFDNPNIRWDQSKWTKAQVWLPAAGRRSESRGGIDDVPNQ